jgi:hypothetical protein
MVLTTVFNILNPIWEGIDEPAHFQDVKYVAETGQLPPYRLPLPTLFPAQNCHNVHCVAVGSATSQPQLYYAIGSLFVRPIDLNTHVSWVPNPYFTWADHPLRNGAAIHTLTELWPYQGMVLGVHVLRFMSGLMGAVTVLCAYLAALALTGRRRFALATGSLAALTPGFLMSTALVTNDNIAAATGSVALLLGVKSLQAVRRRWLWTLLFVASIGLAYASKTDTLFLLPAAVILGLIVFLRSPLWPRLRQLSWRVWITAFASAAFLVATALAVHTYTSPCMNTISFSASRRCLRIPPARRCCR